MLSETRHKNTYDFDGDEDADEMTTTKTMMMMSSSTTMTTIIQLSNGSKKLVDLCVCLCV